MPDRELLFSVTLADCDVQTFAAGGPGGQNQNKRHTGVRIIHHPSGARGESREHREQLRNKKTAFRRMAEHPLFRAWVARQSLQYKEIQERIAKEVEASLANESNLNIEIRNDKGKWVKIDDNETA